MSTMSIKNSTATIAVIVIVIVSLGAGMLISKYVWPGQNNVGSTRQGNFMGQSGPGGQFGAQGMRQGRNGQATNGGGFVSGQVVKKDATSLSIKQRDGSMKLVLISTSTKAMKMTEGSLDDITEGLDVTIMGTSNSDGSITAQTIQARPASQQPPSGQQPGQQPPPRP